MDRREMIKGIGAAMGVAAAAGAAAGAAVGSQAVAAVVKEVPMEPAVQNAMQKLASGDEKDKPVPYRSAQLPDKSSCAELDKLLLKSYEEAEKKKADIVDELEAYAAAVENKHYEAQALSMGQLPYSTVFELGVLGENLPPMPLLDSLAKNMAGGAWFSSSHYDGYFAELVKRFWKRRRDKVEPMGEVPAMRIVRGAAAPDRVSTPIYQVDTAALDGPMLADLALSLVNGPMHHLEQFPYEACKWVPEGLLAERMAKITSPLHLHIKRNMHVIEACAYVEAICIRDLDNPKFRELAKQACEGLTDEKLNAMPVITKARVLEYNKIAKREVSLEELWLSNPNYGYAGYAGYTGYQGWQGYGVISHTG